MSGKFDEDAFIHRMLTDTQDHLREAAIIGVS